MKKGFYHRHEYNIPVPQKVEGATMTIPALAPSLIELLESNLRGEPMPLTSSPTFDKDDLSGLARLQSLRNDLGEVVNNRADFVRSLRLTQSESGAEATEQSEKSESEGGAAEGV